MNALGVSSAFQVPSSFCSCESPSKIVPPCVSTSASPCSFLKPSVLQTLGSPLSPSSSTQRFSALYEQKQRVLSRAVRLKTLRLSDDANALRFVVAETRGFKCRAFGDASSGGLEIEESAEGFTANEAVKEGLVSGSPIVIIEAPPLLKTADSMPSMRPNRGLIKRGDAGRVIDRRPKDVWAVRFAVGAYLIDRKYFEPMEL